MPIALRTKSRQWAALSEGGCPVIDGNESVAQSLPSTTPTMDLLLNHELLRGSLATWREAIVMTIQRRPGGATRSMQELVPVLRGAIQKIDGCLAVLTACEVKPADKGTFDQLVFELRAFRVWLEQGLTAVNIMKTGGGTGVVGKWC